MNNPTESAIASYQRQLEASRKCAQSMLEGASKIEAFVLESARRQVDRAVDFAEACTGARDAEGVSTLQYTFFGHDPEAFVEAQKQLAEIVLQTGVSVGAALAQMIHEQGLVAAGAAGAKGMDAPPEAGAPWSALTQAWTSWARDSGSWLSPTLPPIVTGKARPHGPRL